MALPTADLGELIRAFTRSRFTTLEVSSGEDRIFLKRPGVVPPAQAVAVEATPLEAVEAGKPAAPRDAGAGGPQEPLEMRSALKSPRVGRFYQLQDGQGQPALKSGVRLAAGQVYGIIESMRLRYEIRSEREGIVERVLVPSGEPVEFGQPLVLLQS